jgi:hypothetical protein
MTINDARPAGELTDEELETELAGTRAALAAAEAHLVELGES